MATVIFDLSATVEARRLSLFIHTGCQTVRLMGLG